MTDRAARMITETLFLGHHSDLPTTTVTSVTDAVATIRSGRRALTNDPNAAVEILVALGLDEATAQRRVAWASGTATNVVSPPRDTDDGHDSELIPRPPTTEGSSSTEDPASVEPIDALQLMVAVLKVPGLAAYLVGGGVLVSPGDGTPAVQLTADQVEGWTHRAGPDGEPTIEVRIPRPRGRRCPRPAGPRPRSGDLRARSRGEPALDLDDIDTPHRIVTGIGTMVGGTAENSPFGNINVPLRRCPSNDRVTSLMLEMRRDAFRSEPDAADLTQRLAPFLRSSTRSEDHR